MTTQRYRKFKPNGVKFFSAVELVTLSADRDWLDEAKKPSSILAAKNARHMG